MAVKVKNGTSRFIQEVLYVPSLAQNLLSVGQLVQRGYSAKFDDDNCFVDDKKDDQLIASLVMVSNRIFPLKMPMEPKVALSSTMDDSILWH